LKGNKEDVKGINSLIDSLTLKVNRIYNRLIENEEVITASKIKKVFLGYDVSKKTLLEVFHIHNEMMKNRVGIDFSKSTFTRYNTTYDHISQFLKDKYGVTDVPLKSIQYSFITDLEHFFKVVRKCNHNSTQKYIRNFRKIINMALKNDWLDKDPFKAYRVKLKETRSVFLTREELLMLKQFNYLLKD